MRINHRGGNRYRPTAGLLALLIVTACSSGSADSAETATEPTQAPAEAEPTEAAPTETPALGEIDEATPSPERTTENETSEPVATAVEPAVRLPENPGTVEASNWIARNFMDAQSVDLVWSPVDGAEVYRVYRLPTNEADYVAIQAGDVSGTALVYEGPNTEFVDRQVASGTFLTYVLVAQVGEDLTSPRWTQALTVDDTTPPTPITGLVASTTPDGVLLEWQPSTDDVEFASYSVSILEGDRPRYIGGGADESQTSFLDTDTSNGPRTYVVQAVDFHDNRSDAVFVEITYP